MKILSLTLVGILVALASLCQDKVNVRFGKVSPADFAPKFYGIDSNANAVVIADVGSSQFIGNVKGWFSIEFKRYCRIRLLNKNGFDAATVEIPLWTVGNDEEKLSELKAVTYNLEGDKVVETKLDKSNIFQDKIRRTVVVNKFTLPAIKEGSIIEFQYTVTSDFLSNLQPWTFQRDYPTLWSEYNLALPSFFSYVFISQGFQPFFAQTKTSSVSNYFVTVSNGAAANDHISLAGNVNNYHWVIKDAPALREESYVSTIKNHVEKIEFELTAQSDPLPMHVYLNSWPEITKEMLGDEDFGQALSRDNGWLGDVVKPLLNGATSKEEKAKRIYSYTRDNLTCTENYSGIWLGQSLKNVLKTRAGSPGEINLLLTAMMRYAGIDADPVILSTKSHGYIYAMYPMMEKFNYVICLVHLEDRDAFLDASESRLGFGKLAPKCYNGHAKIINTTATDIEFSADSLMERKATSILINTDEKGQLVGTLQQMPGYYESHEIREAIRKKGKDEFFKEVKKSYAQEVDILNPTIDSLDNPDEILKIAYNFKWNQENADLIYLNPMFGEGYKENPFKSAERSYPVEMPYASDETYVFNLFVPDGYEVDELPKALVVKLNEQGDGKFEYLVSQTGQTVSMRCRLQLKRALYEPEEYDLLREFFNMVVKKQGEQIVLKKKK